MTERAVTAGAVADRLVLLTTSPRVAPGQLTLQAWDVLRSGPVCTGDPGHPQVDALAAAGITVQPVDGDPDTRAAALREAARQTGTAVWLAAGDGDPDLLAALDGLPSAADADVVTLDGSHDLPGARLLDVVRVMDVLRSPGGCPWDAEQTHASLARYLLEEAYETIEAIEHADGDALREELGDVLLQVVFHARVAQEEEPAWSVDDVAAGLVDKLVRRHPHVFDPATGVRTPAQVEASWDEIKKAEKGRTSVTEGVPMGQPALSLAAKLQSRAVRAGLPADLLIPDLAAADSPARAVAAAAAATEDGAGASHQQDVQRMGDLLFAAVALARGLDVDPEAALRSASRRFRDALLDAGH